MSRIFISYSRSEITFVDSLYHELTAAGHQVWIDNYGLQVGQSWQTQIDEAIRRSDILLLVVSPRAIASRNVCHEWDLALKEGKRVILLLFRPTPIHEWACLNQGGEVVCAEADWAKLRACEWVDFRIAFPKACSRLDLLLRAKAPNPPKRQIPTYGLLIPPTPRWFVLLGLMPLLLTLLMNGGNLQIILPSLDEMSVFSISQVFTTILPVLIPALVYARRFGALEITLILLGAIPLNFILMILTLNPILGGTPNTNAAGMMAAMIGVSIIQLGLLGSRGMYRWATGRGVVIEARPQRLLTWRRLVVLAILLMVGKAVFFPDTNPIVALILVGGGVVLGYGIPWVVTRSSGFYQRRREVQTRRTPVRSIAYTVEAAQSDQQIANAIHKALQRHHRAVPLTEAEVVMPLISKYQLTTNANLDRQAVIPIRLEDVFSHKDESKRIDPRLGELQTIDLRRGVSSAKLEIIANNLDEPGRILTQLGEFPRTLRAVRPLAVDWLVLALQILVGFLMVVSALWLMEYGFQLRPLPNELTRLAPVAVDYDAPVSSSGYYYGPRLDTDIDPSEFGATYVVYGFAEGKPTRNGHKSWCLLLGRPSDEPIRLWASDEPLLGGHYYQTISGWQLTYFYDGPDDPSYDPGFDTLETEQDCHLKLVATTGAVRRTMGVLVTSLLMGITGLMAIRRLQKRQRFIYPLLTGLTLSIAVAPHVSLAAAGVTALSLVYAVVNRSVRHYIP